jgi:hypothetical protein
MTDLEKSPAESAPPNKPSGGKDVLALGIGCGVFVIMLVAIVLVGMAGR